MTDRTRTFGICRTEPEPKLLPPNPNRTPTELFSNKMLLFQPKKRFFENQCSENEAKLCDIGRCAIFTKDKLKFLLLFYCKIFFLQLSLLENGIFVVTFIVIWFGLGSVHRTTWFGRTTEPHRTFKFGRTRTQTRTVRSVTTSEVTQQHFLRFLLRYTAEKQYSGNYKVSFL